MTLNLNFSHWWVGVIIVLCWRSCAILANGFREGIRDMDKNKDTKNIGFANLMLAVFMFLSGVFLAVFCYWIREGK